MLALDQRGSFEKMVGSTDKSILIKKKKRIIEALEDIFTGVLLDPKYGLPAFKQSGCLKPYLLCAEKSGYEDVKGERLTEIEYSVEELNKMGASGIKLLVYFNPFLNSAKKQLETARGILEECHKFGLPLFLEIVTYGEDMGKNLIVESVDYFLKNKVVADIFKLQFPGNELACQKISQLLGETNWILLTAGVDFYQFKDELAVACKNGCSGFLAGRSIWQEAVKTDMGKKEEIKIKKRFETIKQIAEGK